MRGGGRAQWKRGERVNIIRRYRDPNKQENSHQK